MPSWLRRFLSAKPQPSASARAKRCRLAFDQLENRLVPATAVSIGSPTAPFLEGVALNFTSTVTNGVTPVYAWSVTKDAVAFAPGTPTDAASFSFTPDDNATYVVSLSVTDPGDATQLAPLTADSGSLIVTNQNPVAGVSGPTTGTFGQSLTFTLTATDASSVDAAAGFTFNIDWNNDGVV